MRRDLKPLGIDAKGLSELLRNLESAPSRAGRPRGAAGAASGGQRLGGGAAAVAPWAPRRCCFATNPL